MREKRELTDLDRLIINTTVGSAKHEGYVDDGFIRAILEKLSLGEVTFEEANKIVKDKYLKA